MAELGAPQNFAKDGEPRSLPLLYFSYGVTKSGSTLAFEMVRTMLETAGYSQPLLGPEAVVEGRRINFAAAVTPSHVAAQLRAAEEIGHPIAIKLHSPCIPEISELLRSGIARAHAVYRDPRDVALSLIDAGKSARSRGGSAFAEIHTLDDAIRTMHIQYRNLCTWLQYPKVEPLYYDDVAFDQIVTIRRMARQIGIECRPRQVLKVIEKERFTQRNKAVKARHETELSAEDGARIAAEFAPLMSAAIENRVRPGEGRPGDRMKWRRELARTAAHHLRARN